MQENGTNALTGLLCFCGPAGRFCLRPIPRGSPASSAPNATQQADDAAVKNAKQARAVLEAMVEALGGQKWLDIKNREQHGHIAAFHHGQPNLGTMEVTEYHMWPDHDRINVDKHGDWVDVFEGNNGWEITFRGKKPMEKEQLDEFLRRRDHSIETAVKVWLKNPQTILVYEGQHLAERHLADQVTLISPENEAITIMTDAESHLPLRRSFQWRDPLYKDKNTDAEEYDDYHQMGGLPTPLKISRWKNDEMVRQFYIDKVVYNQDLNDQFWNVDSLAAHLKR